MAVGLALLLPLYAIGGMGAGDVKLLAGVGAWMGATHTLYAFCVTAIVGAVLAVAMVVFRRAWKKHAGQLWMIVGEILTIRDPNQLSTIAARAQELHVVTAVWNPNRDRVDRLFCLDGDAGMNAANHKCRKTVTSTQPRTI